ncbi:MAG TPA: SRPBCC domain-containing protein [Intrasporangium sp.]|uniref:SRPBCC family protein n=1 Tax=Intrasporangium sp. TaxID=1925024 RepID=UPI002D787EA0|nr:SRPBCC domain-containing protein [Intrasporangium sp.]HET7396906.1 SRPBCC domain-containing protein [Intrasporangium sp.]
MTSSPETAHDQSAGDDDTQGGATEQQTGIRSSVTIPAPLAQVWQHLISSRGTEAWLGSGAVLGSKGESWHSQEGPHGVVRSYHPQEQIRVSWHADDNAPPTMVDLQLVPEGTATRLDLLHDGPDVRGSAEHQNRWDEALQRLARGLDT